MINKILVKRGYLLNTEENSSNSIYYAVKLLNEFGVEVDRPKFLTQLNVETISSFYGKNIPKGFYANPQDTKYFTCDELLLEQLVSYYNIEYIEGVNSKNEKAFDRIELFKKVLPNYKEGDEVVLRKYKIIDKEEAEQVLKEITQDYCKYTRPWSEDELVEVKWLVLNQYYDGEYICCKDNAIALFLEYKNATFAKMLDKKDVVKLSVQIKGEQQELVYNEGEKMLLEVAIKNAYDCPLSKKQAKYFNTMAKKLGVKLNKESNLNSPYRLAKVALKYENVLKAANIFAENGSLLERNLVWLLSRAKERDLESIINLVKVNNPIVLYQLLQGITNDDYEQPRVFGFYNNKRLKHHKETEYEFKYRKSKLSLSVKNALVCILHDKIEQSYREMPKLGKLYIDKEFLNIALPTNTSATGSGLDILPVGSRIKITEDYIRTFCYWNNAYDIDASAVMLRDISIPSSTADMFYWGNYHTKGFGDSALCSGDNRGKNGAEYQDFKISELLEKGYKYVIYTLNGYASDLNAGEIYCGYQNKKDLNTQAWSSKNIVIKIHVKGNSRAYMGFAIDLENKEMIILNQILDSSTRIVSPVTVDSIKEYLSQSYLSTFNMYTLLSYRGELVDNKEEADYVFDRDYIGNENQIVIKPFEIEKLVSLLK